MNLRIISDLHIYYNSQYTLKYYGEDLLIIAGDISENKTHTLALFKKYIKTYNTPIIFVIGNHDYYNSTIDEIDEFWLNHRIDNLYVLQDDFVIINNQIFYGCTLWTDLGGYNNNWDFVKHKVKDYRKIYRTDKFTLIQPVDTYIKHKKSVSKLEKFLQKYPKNTIIITHHLPSYRSIAEKYKNSYDHILQIFYSDLDHLVKQTKMWIHGHTHSSFDYKIDETRVICNPRGRKDENEDYNDKLIIRI